MPNSNFYRIGPGNTHPVIKTFLALTAILSFICAIQISFFPDFPLLYWLSLSLTGFKSGLFFQVITYLFITTTDGLSASFFIHLIFNLYLLWIFGSSLVQASSAWKFSLLFFLSGIFSAFASLAVMSFGYPFYILAGATSPLYAYLIAWVIANPYSELRLFFAIPFRAKWLIIGLLAVNLLFALFDLNFVPFICNLTSAIVGYFFSLFAFQIHSPFSVLARMEKKIFYFVKRRQEKRDFSPNAKVYDIKTQSPLLDDDAFMDAMLSKIATLGKNSLSWRERRRMKKISKKKNQKPF